MTTEGKREKGKRGREEIREKKKELFNKKM
jgi:hypothetical protein